MVKRSVRAALAAAVSALTMTSVIPSAQAAGEADRVAKHSTRSSLTDQNFYFVMWDRFANGDTSNDTGGLGGDPLVSGFDPTKKGFYNGGDLAGLRSRLDYIQGLGTTAIWLTPVFQNKAVQLEDGPSAGYHGYWITDFTRVDPHLGTNAELKALVRAAHRRGMKVFFDIITNHTADVIGYEEGARTAYVSKDQRPYRTAGGEPFDDLDFAGTETFPPLRKSVSFPYRPVLDADERDLKRPRWLNDPRLYHNRGNTTFVGEDALYGDFFGLDDLFTEHPRVVDGMKRIYRTWVRDFGIDGFRIDTVKHVNDEFWQEFAPGILRYARAHGREDFFMFGEVYEDELTAGDRAFLSRYTNRNRLQAVLDFGFQTAARGFTSRSDSSRQLARFFKQDDWYIDRNSNAYQLPTFLGNHDMGRLGYFLRSDNPDAEDAELLARDRLAHQLMYLSRGNPVVYYGDEQGFTGTGGDQLARQTMFASQVPEYQDDDLIGTTKTPAEESFDPAHPLYRAITRLARLTDDHPALRNGAMQVRAADRGPGLFAFSRVDRKRQREYVVVLNNSEQAQSATFRTYLRSGGFKRVYGAGADRFSTDDRRRATVELPALSAAVYRAEERIPDSSRAPEVRLRRPAPSAVAQDRIKVAAQVEGRSFYEVTFQAKVGDGGWRRIGTDDNAPYRVFHDTGDRRAGTPLRYRAVVLDNAGHTRMSDARRSHVPAPRLTISAPERGSVNAIAPVTVTADVDPERATMSVRFQRKVEDRRWRPIGTDHSSPVYSVTDDLSEFPLGTRVRYRALLVERGTPRVVSDPVRVRTAPPEAARDSVTVAGDLQSELGCPTDWDPACGATHLEFDPTDGLWKNTFTLPEGTYSWKIAVNDSWDENYGAGGAAGGDNLTLTVPAGGATYEFTWNQDTHVPEVEEVA